MARRSRRSIYQSRKHLAVTVAFVLLPVLLLLISSRVAQITSRELFSDLAVSIGRLFAAYVISAVLAWCAAVAFYRGRGSAVALPAFDIIQSFPTFAALPLGVLLFGRNSGTTIFFLVITMIGPFFFSIVSSLRLIRRDWEEAVQIAGFNGLDHLRHFLWPASIPGIVTGSIIGLGDGWQALVATEIIMIMPAGLGHFFQTFSANSTVTVFGIVALLAVIFSINKLVWQPLLERSHIAMEE